MDATASETLKRMIGVSAVGSDDARAALQWLVKERTIEMEGDTLFERVAASLVGALQGYLERV